MYVRLCLEYHSIFHLIRCFVVCMLFCSVFCSFQKCQLRSTCFNSVRDFLEEFSLLSKTSTIEKRERREWKENQNEMSLDTHFVNKTLVQAHKIHTIEIVLRILSAIDLIVLLLLLLLYSMANTHQVSNHSILSQSLCNGKAELKKTSCNHNILHSKMFKNKHHVRHVQVAAWEIMYTWMHKLSVKFGVHGMVLLLFTFFSFFFRFVCETKTRRTNIYNNQIMMLNKANSYKSNCSSTAIELCGVRCSKFDHPFFDRVYCSCVCSRARALTQFSSFSICK